MGNIAANVVPGSPDPWPMLSLAVATPRGYLVGRISPNAHDAALIAPLRRSLDDHETGGYGAAGRFIRPPAGFARIP